MRERAIAREASGAVERPETIEDGGPARTWRGHAVPRCQSIRATSSDQQSAQSACVINQREREGRCLRAGQHDRKIVADEARVRPIERGHLARRKTFGL